MTTLIIIPAYNEEKTIGKVIKEAKKYGSVLVVDDASHDSTAMVAKKAGAKVIGHKQNRGLGAGLRTGFAAALKTRSDIIITIDADGQHLAGDIPRFIKKINEGYDFVLGARDLEKYPFIKKFGNFFLNHLTNCISGTKLKDTESGFRAFRRSALAKLRLSAEKYEISAEIVYEIGRNKIKATSIQISSPIYHKNKGVSVADGIKNFLYLLRK